LEKLSALGRILFAVAITAFGVENLICARFGEGVIPVIPWVPGNPFLGYLTGLVLIACGVGILIDVKARVAAVSLGIIFFVCVLLLQTPHVVAHPLDVSVRTGFFETLAICGVALALAGRMPGEGSGFLERSGTLLFALSAVVFGIDHFLVLNIIAGLIPSWIPGAMFWAYFTGAVFIAAGIAFATGWMADWGSLGLGLMFLMWVLVLHGPRVASYPRSHNPNEWSSAFIALAMCGGSWILYSYRSATIGSTLEARSAGTQHASSATKVNITTAARYVGQSVEPRPNRRFASNRDKAREPANPAAIPIAVKPRPWPATVRNTSDELAPSAIRTPIS
jgi:uncharacterized membrane protein YphA (DoxX/SURF4 family)